MLGTRDVTATIAVKDIARARHFYQETLGLKLVDADEPEALLFRSGNSTVLVYESRYAGSNQATALTWVVGDDLDQEVALLKSKGVVFGRYELPGTTREGEVHLSGGTRAAWFMDADGNILAMVNR
ncbi:MAG: VOC family protein [Gemmatimonadales bacterium]|nr:VOC family protein [Gemmatimonadales bacterium]